MKDPAPGPEPMRDFNARVYCPTADPRASPDQSAIFGLGNAIGFACRTLQSLTVLDGDLPTGIRNQFLFPKGVQSLGHAGPADAKVVSGQSLGCPGCVSLGE